MEQEAIPTREVDNKHVLKKAENYKQSLRGVHGSMAPYLTKEVYDLGVEMYGHLLYLNQIEAKAAVDAVHFVDNMLVVGPTNISKSKVYHVPIVYERLKKKMPFVTILVSPFGYFFEMIKEKVKKYNLHAEIFHEDIPLTYYTNCDLILIEFEKLSQVAPLFNYFKSPNISKWIRRVVVEKANMLVEETMFQEIWYNLLENIDDDIPWLTISSTLTLKMKERLMSTFGILFDWQLYQEKALRKNVEYIVVNTTEVVKTINKLYLEEIGPKHTTAIVYVNTTEEAIELGNLLGCTVLHDEMAPSEIVQVYEDSQIPNKSIADSLIVATSKINHGGMLFDISHIINVGSVKKIDEFQRVVEHLWRDQEEKIGKCYFLLNNSKLIENESNRACINGVLSREFEGIEGTCKTLGCLRCLVCDPKKIINIM